MTAELAIEVASPLVTIVQRSLALCEVNYSALPMEVQQVFGFSDVKLRALINHLCAELSPVNFLEVGTFCGATLAAAVYGNQGKFISIDNFSKFDDDEAPFLISYANDDRKNYIVQVKINDRRESIHGVINLWGNGQATFLEQDVFTLEPTLFQGSPINFYFYDGDHSTEATIKGLTHFVPSFADELVLVVDDCDLPIVQVGIEQGLAELPYEVIWEQYLHKSEHDVRGLPANGGWGFGVYVAVLKRNNEKEIWQ